MALIARECVSVRAGSGFISECKSSTGAPICPLPRASIAQGPWGMIRMIIRGIGMLRSPQSCAGASCVLPGITSNSSSACSYCPCASARAARCRRRASSISAYARQPGARNTMCRTSGDHEGKSLLPASCVSCSQRMRRNVHHVDVLPAGRSRPVFAIPAEGQKLAA